MFLKFFWTSSRCQDSIPAEANVWICYICLPRDCEGNISKGKPSLYLRVTRACQAIQGERKSSKQVQHLFLSCCYLFCLISGIYVLLVNETTAGCNSYWRGGVFHLLQALQGLILESYVIFTMVSKTIECGLFRSIFEYIYFFFS